MNNHRVRSTLLLLIAISGCTPIQGWAPDRNSSIYPPIMPPVLVPTAIEREMAKCLPSGLELDTAFRKGSFDGEPTTVLAKLREVGAYCRDGKLRDRWGRELYFHRVDGIGAQPPPEILRAQQEAEQQLLQDLHRRGCRVIEIYAMVPAC